jgi:hypothetical protein
MLRILRVAPVAKVHIEMDESIPLMVDFPEQIKNITSPSLVWAVGDDKSLLEIDIDRDVQIIIRMTLTSYHKPYQMGVPSAYRTVGQISGLPVVDTSIIPRKKNIHDIFDFRTDALEERTGFVVYLEADALFAVFEREMVPSCCYRVGRLGFFEGDHMLIGVGLFDLSMEERALLASHFKAVEQSGYDWGV